MTLNWVRISHQHVCNAFARTYTSCELIISQVLVDFRLYDAYCYYTERPMEDHERVIDALSHWPKVHRNTVHFRNNPNKYLLLTRPQVR